MTWLHVCSLSITLQVTIGKVKTFVGIMLVVIAKSGKEISLLVNENGRCNE